MREHSRLDLLALAAHGRYGLANAPNRATGVGFITARNTDLRQSRNQLAALLGVQPADRFNNGPHLF